MVHLVCEFCGKDADEPMFLLSLTPMTNFSVKDGKIFENEKETKSFVICQSCMTKHSLPSPYCTYRDIEDQKIGYKNFLDKKPEETQHSKYYFDRDRNL